MKQYGNNVLAQYKLPTPEELAALGKDKDDGGDDGDDESTDLEDTEEEGEGMEE
jgi:hypothetical protein